MPVFESKEKMETVLGELFEKLLKDPIMGHKFLKMNMVILFDISDPNSKLWVTPGDGVKWGNLDMKPTVQMSLSGDTCHKFWLKHISMPVALAKGLIKAKGPMPKVLKLLPLLKPAYEAYPEHAKSHGLSIEKE